jgi:hypothetical protein
LEAENFSAAVELVYRERKSEYLNIDESVSQADICLIDGSYRDEVAIQVAKKMRSGGRLLILDNANLFLPPRSVFPVNRGRTVVGSAMGRSWVEFENLVSDWRCLWTTNGVTDTAIYFSP